MPNSIAPPSLCLVCPNRGRDTKGRQAPNFLQVSLWLAGEAGSEECRVKRFSSDRSSLRYYRVSPDWQQANGFDGRRDVPALRWRAEPSPCLGVRLVGFALDSPLEEGVTSELVSGERISLLAGKIQGISSTLALVSRINHQNGYYNQSLTRKFPTRRNRELIGPYQGN